MDKRVIKKSIVFVLTLSILIGGIGGTQVWAEEIGANGQIIDEGKMGDNIIYQLMEDGTLILSGEGEMYNYMGVIVGENGRSPFNSVAANNNGREEIYSRVKKIVIEEGITTIGNGAFGALENLTSVTLPDSMEKIGNYAIFANYNMSDINIPNGVQEIGYCAFVNSWGLEYVNIPKTVKEIGDQAFAMCKNLKQIDISEGVEQIGKYSFADCNNLKMIKIPRSVVSIGENAIGMEDSGEDTTDENGWLKDIYKVVDGFVLYCYSDSAAEEYANANNIAYKYRSAVDDLRFYDENNEVIKNQFTFDGSYTYFMQADGSPMTDTLTYHPDGEHIIYLDANGHEVFNSFQYCPSVGYTCYFDSNGYIYKDEITFVDDKVYYLNGDGKLENDGWFQFKNGRDFGYANWDGTLNVGGFGYDPWGRVVFYHWNGMVARGLITDGQWYYLMDEADGHYIGSFPVE